MEAPTGPKLGRVTTGFGMAGTETNRAIPLYDEAIVEQLRRFWGIDRVLQDFGLLRFSAQTFRRNPGSYEEISSHIFGNLESFQILDSSEVSKLRTTPLDEIEEKLDEIKHRLIHEHDEAFDALRKHPPSLTKANSWLEAEVRFDPLPWEGAIWNGFSNQSANTRLRAYRDENSELPYAKHLSTAYEARNISHYELAVGLCDGNPDTYVLKFERDFQDELDSIISQWESYLASDYASLIIHPELVSPQPFKVCFSLWLWTDIPRFRTRFRPQLDKLLPLLFCFVLPNGTLWLPEPRRPKSGETDVREDHVPRANLLATCLLANSVLSLAREDWVEEYALPACEWIAGKQKPDGLWSDESFSSIDGGVVLPTLLAVAALKKSGQSKFAHNLNQGEHKLIQLQTDSGAWESEFLDTSLVTRKVLNHFFRSDLIWDGGTVGKLERSGREFMEVAKQLLEQGGDANAKMALVALTHGLEFQLYSFLSAPDIAINIFRKDGQQTIGAREAISIFRDHLVNEGKVREGAGLKFQSQMSLMISARDAVVHKNATVLRSDLLQWIREVEMFVQFYRPVVRPSR
jgi:hypothetical protein